MSTTLPLYWNLSSHTKDERIDASAKLVRAIQCFQRDFQPPPEVKSSAKTSIDAFNTQDASYALKRLARGLGSPRESSRLGFAVALTELLYRLNTITCGQIFTLIIESTQTEGAMNGQEQRDMYFARLFGLTSIIQSGLLFRQEPPAYSSTPASSFEDFQKVLQELIALGEKKSWFTESCWWSIGLALDALFASSVPWRGQASDWALNALLPSGCEWIPERAGIWLKYHRNWGQKASDNLAPKLKTSHLLATANLPTLARALRGVGDDAEDATTSNGDTETWKHRPHFFWDVVLNSYFPPSGSTPDKGLAPFQEFFRIAVDESLFAPTASPERKYIGFQLLSSALSSVPPAALPQLFTQNFMRTWINHLAKSDRYLHAAALDLAVSVQKCVESHPSAGFPLVMQLLGPQGNRLFDRITKTKIVETLLGKMDKGGIREYVCFLKEKFYDSPEENAVSERKWAVEQFGALVRSSAVPKDQEWIQDVLEFLVVHGYFVVNRKIKSTSRGTFIPRPKTALSDETRQTCRERLQGILGDLLKHKPTKLATPEEIPVPTSAPPIAGEDSWLHFIIDTIRSFEKDTRHMAPLYDIEEEAVPTRTKALDLAIKLSKESEPCRKAATGARLLLFSNLLLSYEPSNGDASRNDENGPIQKLAECVETVDKVSLLPTKKGKRSIKTEPKSGEDTKPIDLLVDDLIGYLEKSSAFMRVVANRVFETVSGELEESTVHLLLTQLEKRDLTSGEEPEGAETDSQEEEGSDEEVTTSSSDRSEDDDEEDDEEAEVDAEIRKRVADTLRTNGMAGDTESDDDSSSSDSHDEDTLLDDEQMMALDEKLAEIFKSRGVGRSKAVSGLQREATHFKIRVLDFVDTFIKERPESPHTPRTVLPLIRAIMGSGPDEKQLAEKAIGILKTRFNAPKILPRLEPDSKGVTLDIESLTNDFEELHRIARRASLSQNGLSEIVTISTVYLAKVLVHAGMQETVTAAYVASIDDFVTRKNSKIWPAYISDFVRRSSPPLSWSLRDKILEACSVGRSINTFRQMASFQVLSVFLPTITQLELSYRDEILVWMVHVRKVIYEIVDSAVAGEESAKLADGQARDVVKVGLQAVRMTKKVAGEHNLIATHNTWNTDALKSLIERVERSLENKKAPGLLQMMKQMEALLGGAQKKSSKNAQKAAQELPPKEQMRKVIRKKRMAEEMASAEDEGNESGKPKKRTKRTKGAEIP